MKISDLNVSTRQLKAFVALAEQRNFTRAARQCHLSQSAFSTLIRTLEEAISVRLFDRTTRSVEPTVEGRLFLDGASRLLQDLQGALHDIGEHAAQRRGRVALAALPSLAAGWLPGVLAGFRKAYPGIELDVADELSQDCVERVRSGRADFSLAAVRAVAPELHAEPFCSDVFHLVCRSDHALARARRRPSLEDLVGEPLIQLARDSSVRQHVESAIRPMQMHTVMELQQLSTVAGMVRAGLGITVVPALTLFHFGHPDLVARPLRAPGITRALFTIRRSDRALSSAARVLLDYLVSHRPKGKAGAPARQATA